MICPLCKTRRARRSCPALGHQICAVCCGTKRLVEISCPATCAYLATAREHPPAVTVRQQQHDVETFAQAMRDLNERQSQLFFVINTFLYQYQPAELHPLVDDDVIEAVTALAGTFETAARGVIYEHRPGSFAAERLATALKPVILDAGARGGSAFERDASVVLRRIADTASRARSHARDYLDLLARAFKNDRMSDATGTGGPGGSDDPPRLIVP